MTFSSVLALLLLLPSASARARVPFAPRTSSSRTAPKTYPDTSEGLQQFLADLLASTGAGSSRKLTAMLKDAEIPNSRQWFDDTFGPDKGNPWADAYETSPKKYDQSFRLSLWAVASLEKQILTRKVNDAPEPGRAIERDMLDSMKQPVDIYFVAFNLSGPNESPMQCPFAYFMFIDGNFRWDPGVNLADLRSAAGPAPQTVAPNQATAPSGPPPKVEYYAGPFFAGFLGVKSPIIISAPHPPYPPEARAARTEGNVLLAITVDASGEGRDIHILQSVTPLLDEQAIQTLATWRFHPALDQAGTPVSVETIIEVTFRLN